ncbi:MAG TPA: protein kinase [Hyphomicrobiaceae bacterium]|jgi:serine/threonine protein kinase
MEAKPAPSANLLALPEGTELVGDYRIRRVLGTGGFGITYLADEPALGRLVTIKEYFPAEFAARRNRGAAPRSKEVADDYQWGLDRFIEEAQTLARFDHPNIVRVHRYFRVNNTAYMVLHFEEGGSFRAWLKGLKRAPRQGELDRMVAPLLDALDIIHSADFLHRDIAPDNIMVRKDGSPVLIDFGSARGALASHSRTVSALVKPGYSPFEQYATSGANQGPWTDIYALGATLYHAITGKRPPDAPSRVVNDEYVPAREAAPGSYRASFLDAIDKALRIEIGERPQRIADWRGQLLAADPPRKPERLAPRLPLARTLGLAGKAGGAAARANVAGDDAVSEPVETAAPPSAAVPASLVPAPPDAPQPKGQLLDFIEALKKHRPPARAPRPKKAGKPTSRPPTAPAAARSGRAAPASAPAPIAIAPEPAVPPSAPAAALSRAKRAWRIPPRRWASAVFRVAVAVSVTSFAVAYQERVLGTPAPGPTTASSDGAPAAPVMQLVGHQGPVIAVASADEDRWIVSAGADATVRLWSGSSGAPVRTIELSEGAVTAFAVDERRALVGHKGGVIVLWDLERGERLETLRHGTDAISSVAFLGDGILAASQDGSVALFDAGTPSAPAALLDGQEGGGPLVAAAHTRSLFVATGFDGTVRLWKAPGPRLARTYRRLADDITAIDISPDASFVAGGSSDGVVRVWPNPALRGQRLPPVQAFKAHEGRVTAVALGPPGALATAGADGSVKIGSLRPARVTRSLNAGLVRTLSFSRDGRRLFAGGEDGVIRVWSLPALPAPGAI